MKRKVWDITVKDNPNRVVMGENDEFYTTDTEAFLVFNLQDEDFHPQSAMITLENRNDGSLKSEEVEVIDGDIQWEMPERYIEHSGNWQAQLVYEQMKGGVPEKYTSGVMAFTVNSHIKDKKKPSLVEIENWEKFIREGTELIETWEDLEALREENELQRQANYQELLDTGVLQTNINTKLEQLEEEYAPRLTEVTTQLEKARYSRFSNYTYDEIGERLDTIESNTFTSHIFDKSGAPGPKSLLRGNEEAGFYGFVQPHEFGAIKDNVEGSQSMSATNLALAVGLAQGTAQFEDTPWMKFSRNGEILFVPVKPIRHTVSWNSIYKQGAVYGDNTMGLNPTNGRAGNTISISESDNSFRIDEIEDHWQRSGAVIAVPGDTIVAKGFKNSENNGEFEVTAITDYKITVNKTLVAEERSKKVSVYNKKDAVRQDREVIIGENKYKVQLLRGAGSDPLDSYSDADRGLVGEKSQWNNLILPLHEKAKLQDWAYKAYAGTTEDWGVGLTDLDLITHHTLGTGSYQWCQETGDAGPARRVIRGYLGASYGYVFASWAAASYHGWRPVLRLIN